MSFGNRRLRFPSSRSSSRSPSIKSSSRSSSARSSSCSSSQPFPVSIKESCAESLGAFDLLQNPSRNSLTGPREPGTWSRWRKHRTHHQTAIRRDASSASCRPTKSSVAPPPPSHAGSSTTPGPSHTDVSGSDAQYAESENPPARTRTSIPTGRASKPDRRPAEPAPFRTATAPRTVPPASAPPASAPASNTEASPAATVTIAADSKRPQDPTPLRRATTPMHPSGDDRAQETGAGRPPPSPPPHRSPRPPQNAPAGASSGDPFPRPIQDRNEWRRFREEAPPANPRPPAGPPRGGRSFPLVDRTTPCPRPRRSPGAIRLALGAQFAGGADARRVILVRSPPTCKASGRNSGFSGTPPSQRNFTSLM